MDQKKTGRFSFPPIYLEFRDGRKNNIVHLILPARSDIELMVEEYNENRIKGYLLRETENNEPTLLITNTAKPPAKFKEVIRIKKKGLSEDMETAFNEIAATDDLNHKYWEKHPVLKPVVRKYVKWKARTKSVRDSWKDNFEFREEAISEDDEIKHGLRAPQIGAIHAALAHWAVTQDTATIVMPTGIGKTETMLSILVERQCEKLLVVVPTDALREQIAGKFMTLGVLKNFGIVKKDAYYPIVGILKHKPTSIKEVDRFFEKCNVIVTTVNIAGQSEKNIQKRMASHCSHLFIDEAHHTEARTWKEFKKNFSQKFVLQFTATPFRNDGKPLDGKIIFNYPLQKAQREGYYKPINFKPVTEYDPDKSDRAIAKQAIEQLRRDIKKHYDHILMARVNSIQRAEDVFNIYEKYKRFKPVQIHTGIKSIKEREKIRQQIIRKESKIVVCVDMLGEGFDLPELKIAAFHDIRKSLPITLQLVGRFTRSTSRPLGEATVVANIADNTGAKDELRDLYEQDADWDLLLPEANKKINEEQVDLWDYVKDFKNFPNEIPLQNVVPAMSTVIYKTKINRWQPEKFAKGFDGIESFDKVYHGINFKRKTLVIVMGKKIPLKWAKIKEIYDWSWDLHIVYWNKRQNLLFIHSSNTNSYYKNLAKAVAGEGVELIKGENIFRCFSGIGRLKFNNVGLKELLGRFINFTMRVGKDIGAALDEAQKRGTSKAVLIGSGYEGGIKTSIGCSLKGRIWSLRRTNILGLSRWCNHIGKKIVNERINSEKIIEGTLLPKIIGERPQKIPIGIDWPDEFYKETEKRFSFEIDNQKVHLYEADIKITNASENGSLKFAICSDQVEVDLQLEIFEYTDKEEKIKDYLFINGSGKKVEIRYGNNEEDKKELVEYFKENPPTIWFVDGSSLEGNLYTELKGETEPYKKRKIKTWNWNRINIREESQGVNKKSNSIQYRVIQRLKKRNHYDVIFDDDGSGEAADVVALKVEKNSIKVEFYHCKYSAEDTPGGRIKDLYEVCGQAQKSIHWMEQPTGLFPHLLRRENEIKKKYKGKKRDKIGRFEKGSSKDLEKIRKRSMRDLPVQLAIYIVQPGLSKSLVSKAQLELLSVTENYLMETMKIPFGVIASK